MADLDGVLGDGEVTRPPRQRGDGGSPLPAEDAVQEACAEALRAWPRDGDQPAARIGGHPVAGPGAQRLGAGLLDGVLGAVVG
ncbi:hypothetical protein MAHJHV33_48640 [Mycobacterium avium subsp. hominissuis]